MGDGIISSIFGWSKKPESKNVDVQSSAMDVEDNEHTNVQPPPSPPLSNSPTVSQELMHARMIRPAPGSARLSTPSPRSKARLAAERAEGSPDRYSPTPASPFKLPPSPASLVSGRLPPGFNSLDMEIKTEKEIRTLLRAVPPKTLHEYLLTRLSKLPPSELFNLSSVLSDLEPPPLLHCVRCHKAFTEVENTNQSCQIEHDDDSSIVQPVAKGNSRRLASKETYWGCCGQTVLGENEVADGWCYEGAHTIDKRRARWRADSTLQDDKLISCEKKRCFEILVPGSPRRTRDRGKKRLRDPEDEDAELDEVRSVKSVKSIRSTATRKRAPSPAVSVRSTRSVTRRAVSPALSLHSNARQPSPSPAPSLVASEAPSTMAAKRPKKVQMMKPRSRSSSVGPKAKSRVKQALLDASERASVAYAESVKENVPDIDETTTKVSKKRKVT